MSKFLTTVIASVATSVAILGSSPAGAFGFDPPFPVDVVEFHNRVLNHYFQTANPAEVADIDAGRAGPGWIRTGRGFTAYAFTNQSCHGCVRVARFYGTPGVGPNSHFFTENPSEAAGLRQAGSGWSQENEMAFAIPVPDEFGRCLDPSAPVPVVRMYNNRWMFNDSNHRYVTLPSDRDEMRAAGWIDEGVHFCALAVEVVPIKRFDVAVPPEGNILPSAECENDAVRTGGCLAVNNLPVPSTPLQLGSTDNVLPFLRLTDLVSSVVFVTRPASFEVAAGDVFVQAVAPYYGIHVDTKGKAVPALSSLNPLYQFAAESAPPADRFYPWRANYPFATELSIQWYMEVRRIEARGSDSQVYGHPTLEFIDGKSGRHLYFTVLAYSTIADADGDYLALDVGTGKVIVGTTPRADTSFGRNLRDIAMRLPRSFEVGSEPTNRAFDFRVDRTEFMRILAAARSVDPRLSPNPDDYLMDNFHFNNEVYGDGEIGMRIALSLNVMRR